MRIVIAIGGNALARRGESLEISVQQQHAETAAKIIARIAEQHEVIIVHGNGPQVGLLALQAANYQAINPYPLDVLIAESQGMIGYLLQQHISNHLSAKQIVTLLTHIEVNVNDPAFYNPSKPIGSCYTEETIKPLAEKYHWSIKKDGKYFRRVVPSPEPLRIIELSTLKMLIKHNKLIICAGGGGIPVIKTSTGTWRGIEAVIDKDLSAALLAIQVKADVLVILTDIKYVEKNWNTPQAEIIKQITPKQLRELHFAPGSMAPKVEAVCRFVERTAKRAAIGALEDGIHLLEGTLGTQIKQA